MSLLRPDVIKQPKPKPHRSTSFDFDSYKILLFIIQLVSCKILWVVTLSNDPCWFVSGATAPKDFFETLFRKEGAEYFIKR